MTEYYQPVAEKPKDAAAEVPESGLKADKKEKKKDTKKDTKRKFALGSTAADRLVEPPVEEPEKPKKEAERPLTVFERFVKESDDETSKKPGKSETTTSEETDAAKSGEAAASKPDELAVENTENLEDVDE